MSDNHKHRKLCPLCDKERNIQSFTHSGKEDNSYCGVCRLTATISTRPINARRHISETRRNGPKHKKVLHAPTKRSHWKDQ